MTIKDNKHLFKCNGNSFFIGYLIDSRCTDYHQTRFNKLSSKLNVSQSYYKALTERLAISLIGGMITSTFLTRLVVPLIYLRIFRKKYPTKNETMFRSSMLNTTS